MLVKLYQTGFITCPEMRSLCKTYVNMMSKMKNKHTSISKTVEGYNT